MKNSTIALIIQMGSLGLYLAGIGGTFTLGIAILGVIPVHILTSMESKQEESYDQFLEELKKGIDEEKCCGKSCKEEK